MSSSKKIKEITLPGQGSTSMCLFASLLFGYQILKSGDLNYNSEEMKKEYKKLA